MSLLPRRGQCFSCGHDHGDGSGSPREMELIARINELEQERAAWSRAAKPAVPDGYAIVPIEPTQAMIDAALNEYREAQRVQMQPSYLSYYRAMIAAAPAPAVPDAQESDLLDIVRTVCSMAAHLRDMDDEKRKHYPSPLSEFSPLLIAAREACLKRGFTADGLALASAPSSPALDAARPVLFGVDLSRDGIAAVRDAALTEAAEAIRTSGLDQRSMFYALVLGLKSSPS